MGNESSNSKVNNQIKQSIQYNPNNLIEPININKTQKQISPKIVVGIDFGTGGIGYAYSLCDNKKNIILSDLKDQCDNKVPTEIILDNEYKFILAFGNECSGYINSHYDKDSYQYFKDIKMNLYKNNDKIKSTNGSEIDIELIISFILTKISNEAIDQIKRTNGKKFKKNEIRWVVTIPAIWEEKSKQIMINASRKAGLINENTDLTLFLALEPEVAGIFYFSSLYSKVNQDLYDTPYIICDIGSGTVDICTYTRKLEKKENDNCINDKLINNNLINEANENNIIINDNDNLIQDVNEDIFDSIFIEEYPPTGNNYGGNYINNEFIERLVENLFGKEKVEKLKNFKIKKWKEFEEKIEKLKRDFNYLKPNDCPLDCEIFYDKDTNKSLEEYINDYKKNHIRYKYELKINPKEEWELIFPSQIFEDITKEVANEIFLKLEEVFNNVKGAQIIFTGAGSKNTNLIHYISEIIVEKKLHLEIKTTYQPEISIIKGAVLFGFQSNIIRKRKSKYTIGIKTCDEWDDIKYKGKGKKERNELMNRYECTNLFTKFITRNEYFKFNEVIPRMFYSVSKQPKIIFYKTLKDDCKYIDEKDENNNLIIEKFGEIIFDIEECFDMDNRDVQIDIKLGGTYIYAKAEYLINGKSIDATQSFIDYKNS